MIPPDIDILWKGWKIYLKKGPQHYVYGDYRFSEYQKCKKALKELRDSLQSRGPEEFWRRYNFAFGKV
jgi:hypothetical protein